MPTKQNIEIYRLLTIIEIKIIKIYKLVIHMISQKIRKGVT